MDNIWLIPVIMFAVFGFGFVVFFIVALFRKEKKDKEFNEETMRRLPEVEYTEIVSSSNGSNGTISTFNSDGGVGYGSYSSRPTTKFLVVYKSGYKQIVNLRDGIPLFNEYVRLLKINNDK